MTDTPNLGIEYVEASQAQKHVTVNDAFRMLDIVVQPTVLDKDLSAPPASPAPGDKYLIAASATGVWAGHENEMAAFIDGAWYFAVPKVGWQTYVADEATQYVWNGTAWVDLFSGVSGDADTVDGIDSTGFFRLASPATQSSSGNLQVFKSNPTVDVIRDGSMTGNPSYLLRTAGRYDRIQNTPQGLSFGVNYSVTEKVMLWDGTNLRINGHNAYNAGNFALGTDGVRFGHVGIGGATADTTNVLSINGPAALFNHGGTDMRVKVNKSSTQSTASFVFQNSFSSRAEFGLTGNDDFTLKNSADGSSYTDSLVIAPSGVVKLINTPRIGRRSLTGTVAPALIEWDAETAAGVGISYDNTTKRFTVLYAGTYLIIASMFKTSGASATRVYILKNTDSGNQSNNEAQMYSQVSGFDDLNVSVLVDLDAGDYVTTKLQEGVLYGNVNDKFGTISIVKVG